MQSIQNIEPRIFDDKAAAIYCGRSVSWMRNNRYDDIKRIDNGKQPLGPRWIRQGRNIRYYREDLDSWLDSFKEGQPCGWKDAREYRDTSGLKYQRGSAT